MKGANINLSDVDMIQLVRLQDASGELRHLVRNSEGMTVSWSISLATCTLVTRRQRWKDSRPQWGVAHRIFKIAWRASKPLQKKCPCVGENIKTRRYFWSWEVELHPMLIESISHSLKCCIAHSFSRTFLFTLPSRRSLTANCRFRHRFRPQVNNRRRWTALVPGNGEVPDKRWNQFTGNVRADFCTFMHIAPTSVHTHSHTSSSS